MDQGEYEMLYGDGTGNEPRGTIKAADAATAVEQLRDWSAVKAKSKRPHRPLGTTRPSINGKKLGRNELCPCGSESKFKKCCLRFLCFVFAIALGSTAAAQEPSTGILDRRRDRDRDTEQIQPAEFANLKAQLQAVRSNFKSIRSDLAIAKQERTAITTQRQGWLRELQSGRAEVIEAKAELKSAAAELATARAKLAAARTRMLIAIGLGITSILIALKAWL